MNSYQISTAVVLLLSTAASAQRTPTISYITPDITSKIGGTIEMDCSVLYAAEYPVLWVKLPPQVHILDTTYVSLSDNLIIPESGIQKPESKDLVEDLSQSTCLPARKNMWM